MTGHEIRNQILFLSQFPIGFIEPVLKGQKGVDIGLSHEVGHVFDDVFRRHLQLAADVILAEFFDEFFIAVGQHVVIAKAGADEDFLYPFYMADFPQKLQVVIMRRIEVAAGFAADAVAIAAHPIGQLLLAGHMAEVSRRTADVMDITFKARKFRHPFRFANEGLLAAVLNDAPLMAGNGTEMTVAETAALAGQAELYFLQGRNPAGSIVIGMPAALEGQFVNGIHLFRRQGQGRRRLDDEAVFRRLDDGLAVKGSCSSYCILKALTKAALSSRTAS